MTLTFILALTFFAGTGSVWVSGALLRAAPRALPGSGLLSQAWQAAAAGALLATALLSLLPEAIEVQTAPRRALAVMLLGLAIFFVLDRAELWHHAHEHGHSLAKTRARGAWAVLGGDALHAFGDGVLIAATFAADARAGLVAAIAVALHEVPHHIGDLALVRSVGNGSSNALLKVSIAGSCCALGGMAGWWLTAQAQESIPYLLALAAGSFVYVALADLVPQLQGPLDPREGAVQIGSMLAGIFGAAALGRLAHAV